ncbi:MAG: hypothetical protein AVDCRST_MAG93-3322, partial [uncultured Chloroflexia bacterium]
GAERCGRGEHPGHQIPSANKPVEPRFIMLEPIREYAWEQLVPRGEVAALQLAHATYYHALAETVSAQWDSPTAAVAIAQLDREYDNIRAALQWACDGGDRTLGLKLCVALRKFWQRRGYYREGRAWLEELLALDDNTSDPAAVATVARALYTTAWLASDQHDFARSEQLFGQAMALRHTLGETEDDAHLRLNAARQARVEGKYHRAVALFEEALLHHRSVGNRGSASSGGLGQSLYDLALVRREQGHFADASALLSEGIAFHREIGEREGEVVGLLGLGDIARDQGDALRLREYSERSLAISRDLGIRWATGFALNNLARAAYMEGDLPGALALVDESLSIFRDLQSDASRAEVLITQGHMLLAQGDRPSAYTAFHEALRLAATLGPRLMVASALEGLGSMAAEQGQAVRALHLLGAASRLRVHMGTPVRPADQPAVEHALV